MDNLSKQAKLGDEIRGHKNFYKIRYPNPDACKGKSGGFRVIYFWNFEINFIVLTDIYSKTDQIEVNWNKVNRAMEDIESDRI